MTISSQNPSDRAETVAEYLLSRVKERSPHTWRQAKRKAPSGLPATSPNLATFAEQRVRCVSELAVRGLALLAADFPVRLLESAPRAEEVLALQARGARCVTLLPQGVEVPAPHADRLDFALHDLCHLAKFADAALFREQVGFFTTLELVIDDERWRAAERELDASWRSDWQAVTADMNGSSVYLFGVLKMRLKMAARRCLARRRGVPAPVSGPALPEETAVFGEFFAQLLEAMKLPAAVRDAAWATNTRRDDPLAATCLAAHFQAVAALPEHGSFHQVLR